MATTHRFICDPDAPSSVLEWFRALQDAPDEVEGKGVLWLHFRSLGPLAMADDGSVDFKRSPLAGLVLPRVRRKILWTVGEVRFLATPLRSTYPRLYALSSSLRKWLESFECVFCNRPGHRNEWDYYLEGSVRSWDAPVYALNGGLDALRRGQYFVSAEDNDFVLDGLCSSLRLRGVQCEPIRESASPPK
ncbi:MAG TPA: hypothetical protein VFB75_11140 [Burkholderiales bacterium]|nr:hypothetical protein [Burkholderiales bacterium]